MMTFKVLITTIQNHHTEMIVVEFETEEEAELAVQRAPKTQRPSWDVVPRGVVLNPSKTTLEREREIAKRRADEEEKARAEDPEYDYDY